MIYTEEELVIKRTDMVKYQIKARGITNPKLLSAMVSVERHEFVDSDQINSAYGDHPLPIGSKQTISQPYIVALMTDALGLIGDEKVLEIGTGSGYQTAILALMAKEVFTIERHEALIAKAEQVLQKTFYQNIHFRVGDGTLGWAEASPFDRIIVTAAAPHVPKILFEQLAIGGRMVVPVGNKHIQDLQIVLKKKSGIQEVISRGGCRFVSLIGKDAWKNE